ncbi:hypothetical protein [Winogradskyella flava]|uniref:DUF4625 domain-containing protein n=1 Tax=Winogradskyella flava TaxID=1884876 RepID=A0A842IQ16_9FLAO|nr:hypothetical protein [Winogradskyella flava]MBC2843804.1 hypothetical protein [Winogradskyella flava]
MKKFVYLLSLVLVTFTSCSLDEASRPPQIVFVPIESVVVPEEFVFGETHEISMTYTKPSSCYVFNRIFFEPEGQERTVAVINSVYDNADCTAEPEETIVSFDFTVLSEEPYIFKFYQGLDDTGADSYHIIEIPVVTED